MTAELDPALLAAARAGDPAAIAWLVHRVRSRVRRYAERSCLVSDVDDAVQETLLILSRYVASLRHAAALSRWLFRVARRECHRLARRALGRDLWGDDAVEALVAQRGEDELRIDLSAALESLPESYRVVLMLRDLEELTIGEIAERLAISNAAVKGRLHRARELTREYLMGGGP